MVLNELFKETHKIQILILKTCYYSYLRIKEANFNITSHHHHHHYYYLAACNSFEVILCIDSHSY